MDVRMPSERMPSQRMPSQRRSSERVTASAVQARRPPALDPPFDDEALPPVLPGPAATGAAGVAVADAPMLPICLPSRGPRPQRPVTPRQPRGPQRPGTTPGTAPVPARSPGGVARDASPGRTAAHRFVGVCVEVLNGHRPATHLRTLTTATELSRVTDQLLRRTTRAYLARQGRAAPRPHRVRLRGLHICEPRDGIAELAAVLEYGSQTWAMAARLERRTDTWLCTVVQVV